MANHLLVDLENIQPTASAVADWMGAEGKAWIFYGPHQHKLLASFRALGERVTLIPISRPGANSLDFHLVFYLGYLAAGNPESEFTVLSKDRGYDPAISHARVLTFAVKRRTALPSVVTRSVTNSTAKASSSAQPNLVPKSPVAVKSSEAKKLPAKAKQGAAKKVTPVGVATAAKKEGKSAPSAETLPTRATFGAETSRGPKVPPPALLSPIASSSVRPSHAKTPVAMRSTTRPAIAVYRDVLADLRGSNRPRSLEALQRHIETRLGTSATPDKVQAVIDHLKTADIVQVVAGQLSYLVATSTAAQSNQ